MTHEKALKIVQDAILEEEGISPDKYTMECSFDTIEVDSLSLVKLALAVEDKFKWMREIGPEKLNSIKTVGDLVRVVETYE